jgi:hypothetical protein
MSSKLRLGTSLWRKPTDRFWVLLCRGCPPLCAALAAWRQSLFRYDPEVLEVQTAVMAVGAGLWIALPGYHPDRGGWGVYELLIRTLPDWAWSLTFVCLGVMQTLALCKRWTAWRAVSAMLSFVVWSSLSVLLVVDLSPGPATVIFPVIALSEAWVYLRLASRCDVVANDVAAHEVMAHDEMNGVDTADEFDNAHEIDNANDVDNIVADSLDESQSPHSGEPCHYQPYTYRQWCEYAGRVSLKHQADRGAE